VSAKKKVSDRAGNIGGTEIIFLLLCHINMIYFVIRKLDEYRQHLNYQLS